MNQPHRSPDSETESPQKPQRDPAARRFLAITVTRLMGVSFVIVGMLVATGRPLPATPPFPEWVLPTWVGYVLIANGLVDAFVLPVVMARKWRTPKQDG